MYAQAWKNKMKKMEVFGTQVEEVLGIIGRFDVKRVPGQWRICMLQFTCKNNGVCLCAGNENLVDFLCLLCDGYCSDRPLLVVCAALL